ncbi:phasin family protein [Sphingomonas montana]|uniref:phasin family protein n=1 Tax=Sphingomonas montana TaxID=1843236 RepID=UPI001F0B3D04|nr:phasin family protein [Sphingomonas montana]
MAAMIDPAAASAAIDGITVAPVERIEPVAVAPQAAVDAIADAPEMLAAQVTDVAATATTLAERTVETVAAHSQDLVSAPAKGPLTMATAFDTTKTQDMMGDISTKAKGAMEKGVKFAEDMTEFTKGNVEALVASGRVAAKGMESMAQDAAETAKSSFEQAQTAMKSFTQVKSPTELFQLQSDYAKTAFDQLVANASKASEQMMKFMGDVAQPLSNRYALASEKVKSAAF